MPWFRVDDGFATHPKVLATSLAARGLWVTAGSWSSAHLTEGVVPDHVLASLGGTPELAKELVAAGLWRRVRGAWKFHDFLLRNPSREAVENERAAKTERQRRWREKRGRRPVDASTQASRDAPVDAAPPPTRPEGSGSGKPDPKPGGSRASPPGSPPPAKPPWCGQCDQRSRQTGDPPGRCPNCHPLASPNGRTGRHAKETT